MTRRQGFPTVTAMVVNGARAHLPANYRRLLAWLDDGLDHREIAFRLGIDEEAVGPLVALAHRKLAALGTAAG